MANETDSLALLSNQPKNAKSAIIQKLSKQWPLTAKQLTHSVQREYGMDITYQAVHKALLELEKEQVVVKNASQWKLNQKWLHQNQSFIEQALQKYQGENNRYSIDLNRTETQHFEFDNLTDFAVETAKLVADRKLCQSKEEACWIMEYGYCTPKFKFEHLELLFKLVVNSPESKYIIRKSTPFGEWIAKQYNRVGGGGRVGVQMDVDDDFLIQGEWIGQFHFSPEAKKLISKLYHKWRGLDDCYREYGLKEEPRMAIKGSLTKNPQVASMMYKQFQKYLKEGK